MLFVDNNPMLLEFAREVLTGRERSVKTVDNGLDALEAVKLEVHDIIFVDLIMPQIDGKQLCRLLRNEKNSAKSFIVIISAIAAEEYDFDFTAIADAYIAKTPFKTMRENLLTLVENVEQGNTKHYRDGIIGLDQLYHRDITEELLFSKRHLEVLLSSLSDGFIELSGSGKVIFANEAASQFFDIGRDKLLTSYLPGLFSPDITAVIERVLGRMNGKEVILGDDEDIKLKSRCLRLRFNTVSYSEYRSTIIIIQDITRQKKADGIIRLDLQKKETLLKEVHHRVKNNLNVIASLLSLQTSFISDDVAIKHLTDSRNRVESMALLHEKLYNTEDLSGIYLDTYLEDLTAQLISTYTLYHTPVRSYLSIPKVHINIAVAVPLGLIINELITNSLEHGLKNRDEGTIEIHFEEDASSYRLVVKDNGIGLPGNFDINASDSLGLILISNLCAQINAVFSIESNQGTAATLSFDKEHNILFDQDQI
jgi:two-component sensor histidine kinase/DNA-binding NarL/FixJ family response regulator